jgi:hypothetical protein
LLLKVCVCTDPHVPPTKIISFIFHPLFSPSASSATLGLLLGHELHLFVRYILTRMDFHVLYLALASELDFCVNDTSEFSASVWFIRPSCMWSIFTLELAEVGNNICANSFEFFETLCKAPMSSGD